jgi:hypothetical protein
LDASLTAVMLEKSGTRTNAKDGLGAAGSITQLRIEKANNNF